LVVLEVKDELERLMYDVKRTANSVRTNLKGTQSLEKLQDMLKLFVSLPGQLIIQVFWKTGIIIRTDIKF